MKNLASPNQTPKIKQKHFYNVHISLFKLSNTKNVKQIEIVTQNFQTFYEIPEFD